MKKVNTLDLLAFTFILVGTLHIVSGYVFFYNLPLMLTQTHLGEFIDKAITILFFASVIYVAYKVLIINKK